MVPKYNRNLHNNEKSFISETIVFVMLESLIFAGRATQPCDKLRGGK